MPELSLNDIKSWSERTAGLSIDELKETVLAVDCLGKNLENVVKRILALKGLKRLKSEEEEEDYN